MKKIDEFGSMMLIGTAAEIKAVWKSINRHGDKMSPVYGWFPEHLECPRFNPGRMYGLRFDTDSQYYNVVGPREIEEIR